MQWVHAAERAYVAAATRARDIPPAQPPSEHDRLRHNRAVAAAGAVASRFLAVGTPRSFGIAIDASGSVDTGALTLVAHRTWFAPSDIRCASASYGGPELAAATGGRLVSLDEALACDIVCVVGAYIRVHAHQLRRGTHLNVEVPFGLDPALHDRATIVRESELPALAAGLVDGRQLDEITICIVDHPPALLSLDEFLAAT